MSRESDQLELLAAYLYADAGRLRFRDRLRIERCLFRMATKASREVGCQLRGLDASKNRTALQDCRAPSVVRLILRASALKARLATVSTVDAYVHREYDGILKQTRQRELQRLALNLSSFATKWREREARVGTRLNRLRSSRKRILSLR
jgi:hypothetical protein